MTEKTELFVCGCPHSGTTRFARLLNTNPDVCMAIERAISFLQTNHRLPVNLFEKSVFFDFNELDKKTPDTSPTWKAFYDDLAARWDNAKVVGDKIPSLFMFFPAVLEDFPNAKFIFLSKNIYQVAQSWDKRNHLTGRNYLDGVNRWNRANKEALKAIESNPGNWLVVKIERFFEGRPDELKRVADFMGVDLHPAMLKDFENAVRHFKSSLKDGEDTKIKDPEKLDTIQACADFDAYDRVLEYS